MGVYIHNIEDTAETTEFQGSDPFVALGYTGIKTYDWVNDDGYNNLGDWVEAAAKQPRKT